MIYIIHHTSVDCQILCVCSLFFCLERCVFVCFLYPFFIPLCGKVSTCWSPGQPDGDCPNFGLCCFDGCANTCGEGDDAIIFFSTATIFFVLLMQLWFTVVRHLPIPSRIHGAEAPTANNCYYSWLQLWRAKGIDHNTGRICFWWQKLHLSFYYA